MRNMQKRPKIYEYSGAGWHGQVYEFKKGSWDWTISMDFGDKVVHEGGHGFPNRFEAYWWLRHAYDGLMAERDILQRIGSHLVAVPER